MLENKSNNLNASNLKEIKKQLTDWKGELVIVTLDIKNQISFIDMAGVGLNSEKVELINGKIIENGKQYNSTIFESAKYEKSN